MNFAKFLRTPFSENTSGRLHLKVRRVKSISEDAIFTVTSSLKKLSQHLQLGVATDSRKVIDILNRLGHCASDSTIEGMETKKFLWSQKKND